MKRIGLWLVAAIGINLTVFFSINCVHLPPHDPLDRRLFDAALKGDAAAAQRALDKGANVNTRDEDLRTPLHVCGTKEVAQVLLAHGADVNAEDELGHTPLDCVGYTIVGDEYPVDQEWHQEWDKNAEMELFLRRHGGERRTNPHQLEERWQQRVKGEE